MSCVRGHINGARYARAVAAVMLLCSLLALTSCAGPPKPIPAPTAYRQYRSEAGELSIQVPSAWKVSESSGLGGAEITVRANNHNWIAVSRQILSGRLEAGIIRSDMRERVMIEAVQAHYDRIEQGCTRFHGDAPQVLAGGLRGSGRFTCEMKRPGFGGGTIALRGETMLIIGLDNLYIVDAFAEPQSWPAVEAAFERITNTFAPRE